MRPQRNDDVLLSRYLLGHLSEQEQVQVEDRAFADAGYLGALEAVEADLIDSYVRGELSPADRRGFERRFLSSPQRRSKVEFARALAMVTAELKASESAPRPSAWQSLLALILGVNPGIRLAAAMAALIAVAGVSWLTFESATMRARLSALEAQRQDAARREAGLRRQLDQEQGRARSLAAELQKRGPGGEAPPLVASLVLLPGLTRAETARKQLVLNPSAPVAHVEIQLEPRDEYSRFRAELRTRRGEEVLIQGNLPRRRTGAGYSVSFDLPASALANGEYELTLKGLASGRSPEDIGFYYFSVVRH